MYVPEKIEVAYNKRGDTISGLLGFIVPHTYNRENELVLSHYNLKKIMKWSLDDSRFEDDERRETFDNIPKEGFICNSLAGGVGSGWGWYDRQEKIRIHHPDGFEFEIQPYQFFNILTLKGCQPGGILNGEYILYWDEEKGTSSVNLISVDDPKYIAHINGEEYVELYEEDDEEDVDEEEIEVETRTEVAVEDLIIGHVYDIDDTKYIYLGEYDYYDYREGKAIKFESGPIFSGIFNYYSPILSGIHNYKYKNYINEHYIYNKFPWSKDYLWYTERELDKIRNIKQATNKGEYKIYIDGKLDKFDIYINKLIEDNIIGVNKEQFLDSLKTNQPLFPLITKVIDDEIYLNDKIYKLGKVTKVMVYLNEIKNAEISYDSWRFDINKIPEPTGYVYEWYKKDYNFERRVKESYIPYNYIYSIRLKEIINGKRNKDFKYLNTPYDFDDNKIIVNISDNVYKKMNLNFVLDRDERFRRNFNKTLFDALYLRFTIKVKDKEYLINTNTSIIKALSDYTGFPITVKSLSEKISEKFGGKRHEYILEAVLNNSETYTYSRKQYETPQEYFEYKKLLHSYIDKGLTNENELLVNDIIELNFGDYLEDFLSNATLVSSELNVDHSYSLDFDAYDRTYSWNEDKKNTFFKNVLNHFFDTVTILDADKDSSGDLVYLDLDKYSEKFELPTVNINPDEIFIAFKDEMHEVINYLKVKS